MSSAIAVAWTRDHSPPGLELPGEEWALQGPLRDYAQTMPYRHEAGSLAIPIGQTQCRRLARMARSDASTPNALLVACVGLLVGRHGGLSSASLAITCADGCATRRTLRIDWDTQTTLPGLLSRLMTDLSADVDRGPSRAVTNAAPRPAAAGSDSDVSKHADAAEPNALEPSEIAFEFIFAADSLAARLTYNALLYRPSSIAVLARQWRHVLSQTLDEPSIRIASIDLHDGRERDRILRGFNRNRRHFPRHQTLSDLIEAQAQATPDAICAVHQEETLTYRALDEAADRWAGLLRTLGVGPGRFVPIFEPRGLHFVTAMLAIWKAGGAYVPVDTDYPTERVRYMLADSEADVLIVGRTGLARLGELGVDSAHLRGVACLDEITSMPPGRFACRVYGPNDLESCVARGESSSRASTRDPAYMVYTSGSTGLPKGAIVRHDGAVNHIFAQAECLGRTAVMNILQSAPSSSDISVWQFAAPLVLGGRTVILDSAGDVEAWVEQVQRHRPGVIELVPSVMKHLIGFLGTLSAGQRALPGLRWAMLTGEPVPVSLINAWLALYPSIPVVNAYGPTEAADDIAQAIITHPLPPRLLTAPIGKSLSNLDVHILDHRLEPSPIGVPGQICVAGVGVGAGYWKQDEKTRASFCPNPLPDAQGDVLYLTGDIGRRLDDGTLECFGRLDSQVKLHGRRIELAEIETVLSSVPDVGEVVVTVSQAEAAHSQLVAFVVGQGKTSLDVASVRSFLAAHLPKHMLPSHVMVLPKLPLGPAGKIDRQALGRMRLPQDPQDPLDAMAASPASPAEAVMAAIWREEFGRPHIGVNDDFFDLGGDSMTALGIVTGARHAGFRIRPSDVFDHPTIARLAAMAPRTRTEPPARGESSMPTRREPLTDERRLAFLQEDSRLQDVHALSPTQQSIYLHCLLCTDKTAYVDQYCYRLDGRLDRRAFEARWQSVAARHPALRSAVSRKLRNGRPTLVVYREARVPLEWVDATGMARPAQHALLSALRVAEVDRGFPLDIAPLMRLTVVQLDTLSHYLIWTHHHLILDGWSLSLLLQEVAASLDEQPGGAMYARPAPAQSDLVDWLARQDPAADEAFWRHALAGWTSDKQVRWPVTVDCPQRFEARDLVLSTTSARALAEFARANGVTLGTLIHAGWAVLQSRLSGCSDVLFGTVSSGREIALAGIESLVGLAIVTLPLRLDVPAQPNARAWLQAVQAATSSAREHPLLTPGEIQKCAVPSQAGPLFETLVVISNYPQFDGMADRTLRFDTAEFRTVPAYPVTLVVTPGSALALRLIHDPQRCDGGLAGRVLTQFAGILEQMALGVDVPAHP